MLFLGPVIHSQAASRSLIRTGICLMFFHQQLNASLYRLIYLTP